MYLHLDQPPYIIGEVGACHNGVLKTALELIGLASESGCHAVKFQLYNAERLAARRFAPTLLEKYARYQLSHAWLPTLLRSAHDTALQLVLTVYDQEDLRIAVRYADWLKVSSFEAQDYKLLSACAEHKRPLIISSGMSTEIDLAQLRAFRETADCEVALLHCISSYPAPLADLNLSVIRAHHLDGFSDHSGSRIAGATAVAYGAEILEVHIRLTDTPEDNPDFRHALNPSKLTDYVRGAIDAQVMGGSGRRTIMPSEQTNLAYRVKGT